MSYEMIPTSAPFDETQRAWLNGFLSGFLGVQESATRNGNGNGDGNGNAMAVAASAAAAVMNGVAGPVQTDAETVPATAVEDFPWKDDSLPILQRVELSEGRPLERRLMSAMAQLDCGTCGYVCQTYSEAIAAGEEKNLKLCTPGGNETAKMVKQLLKESTENGTPSASNGSASNGASNGKTNANANSYSRSYPFAAKIVKSEKLSGPESGKHISHVEIDLTDSDLNYKVGDALGVFPTNCPDLVESVIDALGFNCEEQVAANQRQTSLTQSLRDDFDLASVTDELVALIAANANEELRKQLTWFEESEELDEMDVLDLIEHAREQESPLKATPQQFIETLSPISPRLYSIASSIRRNVGQVHLTVGRVEGEIHGRRRKGVASTMFSDRMEPGDTVRVFVQPSHGFGLPADPTIPIIMVGPGTGIAPFRAFLQERACEETRGESWLFFGDQTRKGDFIYEQELSELISCDVLTRLDLAFSRDQSEKIYVQDRMLENAAELYAWLQRGAHFYVCGDARRMASDVDRALHEIIAKQADLSEADTKAYVTQLKETGRYQRDVY